MKTILAIFCLLIPFATQAKDLSSCNKKETAFEQVECEYNSWRIEASQKIQSHNNPTEQKEFNTMLTFADAIVKTPITDPNYLNARSQAYEEALITAYAKIAQEHSLTYKGSITSKLLSDATPLNTENQSSDNSFSSKIERIYQKFTSMIEGKLDQKLEELGISPEEFKKSPKNTQKDLINNSITQKATIEAIDTTSGMIPVQTFIATDKNGTTVVRVVISKSPKRSSLVKTMLKRGRHITPIENKKTSKTLEEMIILQPQNMMSLLGTRLIYDQDGFPTLISFGQASYNTAINPLEFNMNREEALRFAEQNAINAMTFILNQKTIFNRTTTQLSSMYKKQTHTQTNNGTIDSITVDSSYQKKIDEKIETSSYISDFTGIKTFHQWTYKDPKSGRNIVGIVKMWSPKTAQNSFNTKNSIQEKDNTPKSQPTPSTKQSTNNDIEIGVIKAMETDDYDF